MSNPMTLQGANLLSGLDPCNVTLPGPFSLHALRKQDIWHPPEVPKPNQYDTPATYLQYGPIHKFKRAQVDICDFGGKKEFDSAALMFIPNSAGPKGETYDAVIKAGVEVVDEKGTVKVMAVATSPGYYSDWSLVPRPDTECVTMMAERLNTSAWMDIYVVDGDNKTLMRRVTWPFQKVFDKKLAVGVTVARHDWLPGQKPFTGEPVSATFKGLKIEWDNWNGTTSKYNV